jgi:hypothetical protein
MYSSLLHACVYNRLQLSQTWFQWPEPMACKWMWHWMGEGGIHKWTVHLHNHFFYLHMNRTLLLHRKSINQLRTILHRMTPLKGSLHVPSDSQVLIPRYWFSLHISLSLTHTDRQTYTQPSNNRHSTPNLWLFTQTTIYLTEETNFKVTLCKMCIPSKSGPPTKKETVVQ